MNPPRLLIAGTGGDSGKTLVALGLTTAWRHAGKNVVTFKKGPDYIDSAWLSLASGRDTWNLDQWLMGSEQILRSFTRNADRKGINLIEGNRGLYDGEDALGTHSSAELAKLLQTPVVVVIPVRKVTRTAAAVALGLKLMDPDVHICGVILNLVATSRQESIIRNAIENEVGLKVIGAIPRIRKDPLPGRHLGLVTPSEHEQAASALNIAAKLVQDNVDTKFLENAAETCESIPVIGFPPEKKDTTGVGLRIGYFSGSTFTFYYPDNFASLRESGAGLIPIDPSVCDALQDIDALYIGGGFPETHAPLLASNVQFLKSVRRAVEKGMPVWAECGGLMFLSRQINWQDGSYPMAGVFPIDIEISSRPQGHGYMEVAVDNPNPFFKVGSVLKGHEFHYSRIITKDYIPTAFSVTRGVGIGEGRDGLIYRNVLACYLHLHSLGTPEWAENILTAAKDFRSSAASTL